jgi:hypothetical protein
MSRQSRWERRNYANLPLDEWAKAFADLHDQHKFCIGGTVEQRELDDFQRIMRRWLSPVEIDIVRTRANYYSRVHDDPRCWDPAGGF